MSTLSTLGRHHDGVSRLSARFCNLVFVALLLAGCATKVQQHAEAHKTQDVTTASKPTTQESQQPPPRQPLIVAGSGKLVGTSAPRAAAPPATGEGYQLSFVDMEISAVVASVIGDGLGLPYLVDPQVKGTMTLQAARPLAREEVLPALEAALNVHGAALIESAGVYQVVPLKDAPRRVSGLRGPGAPSTAGFAVVIAPLKYVSAVEMEKVLKPFAPDGGVLRVDEARNLLVLSGTSRDLAVMQEIISTFDVDWLSGMSFAIFPVEYVDAKTLADELGSVFGDNRSPIAGVVRFVPLSRLNSLMVITHDAEYLQQVATWIHRLDIGVSTPGRRIYVYDVQNGKADDLASSLAKILSISVDQAQEPQSQGASRLFDSGSRDSMRLGVGGGGISSMSRDEPLPPRSRTESSTTATTRGDLKVVPNVENNALLIYATPSEFSLIETALKRLDAPPIQVLIEASLAEVSLTDDLRFGLQWAFQGGDGPLVLSEGGNDTITPKFPGFSYLFTGRTDIRAVLNAIENVTDVNVISSPKLLVLNNREAELQIGDQVPITVQSAVGTTNDNPAIVNSIQLRDTGVILRITPRVNRSGMVLLDVAQEVSDVVPTTSSNIDSPTIQQRRIASTIAVRNGETIALGGLIRDSNSRTRGGVPLVTKIPFVGGLFGTTSKNNRRTELIVLITPRVIRSTQEAEEMMDDLKQQFRGLKDRLPGWGVPGSSKSTPAAGPATNATATEAAKPQQ